MYNIGTYSQLARQIGCSNTKRVGQESGESETGEVGQGKREEERTSCHVIK